MAGEAPVAAAAAVAATTTTKTTTTGSIESHKKNRIQVSNTKKPLFFYVNLAKRYIQQHDEVELSALGMGMFLQIHLSFIIHITFEVFSFSASATK
ncbi:hypothetical protein CICLE_v10030008mg [Citrus x clementina]|uniref:DNA/RNA-binding protein Alba-like domain-containing protein n=1 Tax=Citrus clementina TaxID=85681 RepID=V4S9V2_CITCL|nr:hypothetical protein CICLE_v10030008mg [Citrus x clementina]